MKRMDVVIAVSGLVILCLLSYSVVSTPFTPPSASSNLAAVPPIPLAGYDANIPTAELGETYTLTGSRQPADSPEVSPQPADTQRHARSVIQEFNSRHKSVPENPWPSNHDGLRKDLYGIGYAVLTGIESHGTLLKLLNDPDRRVRITAIQALLDAQSALGENGGPTLNRLCKQFDDQQSASVVTAAVETLVQATHDGADSNAPYMLSLMGDRALLALPHLIWASDNHPSANMRTFTMNAAVLIDPNSNATRELLQRRHQDANSEVRRESWFIAVFTTFTPLTNPYDRENAENVPKRL